MPFKQLLNWMEYIEDVRQKKMIRHLLKDILVIVLFATLANADDWVEIALLAQVYGNGEADMPFPASLNNYKPFHYQAPCVLISNSLKLTLRKRCCRHY